jgi:hypothetical protein
VADYTEADVQLAIAALGKSWDEGHDTDEGFVRAVLDALIEAGRLLPELPPATCACPARMVRLTEHTAECSQQLGARLAVAHSEDAVEGWEIKPWTPPAGTQEVKS